jgi:excisionase family DNA binding protein
VARFSLPPDQYVGSGSAARRLGVSEARVRQLLSSGQLPSVSTELGRLIPKPDLERLAREREVRRG